MYPEPTWNIQDSQAPARLGDWVTVLGWWDPQPTGPSVSGRLWQYGRKGGVLPPPPTDPRLYRCTPIPMPLARQATTAGELLRTMGSLWGFPWHYGTIRNYDTCYPNGQPLDALPPAQLYLMLAHSVERIGEAQRACRLCKAHLSPLTAQTTNAVDVYCEGMQLAWMTAEQVTCQSVLNRFNVTSVFNCDERTRAWQLTTTAACEDTIWSSAPDRSTRLVTLYEHTHTIRTAMRARQEELVAIYSITRSERSACMLMALLIRAGARCRRLHEQFACSPRAWTRSPRPRRGSVPGSVG
jgi:hypothetical protein